jgi:hypothetical protein
VRVRAARERRVQQIACRVAPGRPARFPPPVVRRPTAGSHAAARRR